jgi:hypothetical protein
MPLVIVRRRASKITDARIKHIAKHLPEVVAQALSCEEGRLTPEDIMIQVDEVGPLDSAMKDLNVTIYAHDYPERAANLAERCARITREFQYMIGDGQSWYIWVFLQKSCYGSDTMS